MSNNDNIVENNAAHPDRPWDNMPVAQTVEILQEMNGQMLGAQGAMLAEIAQLRRLVMALVAHAGEGAIPRAEEGVWIAPENDPA